MNRQERQVARLSQCLDDQGTDAGDEFCVQGILPLPLFDFFVTLCVCGVGEVGKKVGDKKNKAQCATKR